MSDCTAPDEAAEIVPKLSLGSLWRSMELEATHAYPIRERGAFDLLCGDFVVYVGSRKSKSGVLWVHVISRFGLVEVTSSDFIDNFQREAG